MKKISIITVNYNQISVTMELLHSLEVQDYKNLEVIVVDNASKENPAAFINSEYAQVQVIRSERNLGFAGGNNLGIAAATGDYLFFVNNDTEIPSGTIQTLVDAFENQPETGVVCPVINYYDQPDITQYAGYTPINTLTGRNAAIGYKQQLAKAEKYTETNYGHGAAMMVSREVIEKVGVMPENYFLYYEELDWGSKIRKAGFKIKVAHSVRIFHKESISTGKSSPLKTYFQTRNRLLFMRRNATLFQRVIFFAFFAMAALPKSLITFLMKSEMEHFKSVIQAVMWNLSNDINSEKLGYKYDSLVK